MKHSRILMSDGSHLIRKTPGGKWFASAPGMNTRTNMAAKTAADQNKARSYEMMKSIQKYRKRKTRNGEE